MKTNAVKSIRDLRKFGFIMTVPLAVIGGLALWRGRAAGPYLAALAVFFLAAALLFPRALAPIERTWMAFATKLSVVMTYVVLTLTFYLVITPFGLLLRLLGKDLLQRKLDSDLKSYWMPAEADGPGTRPDKPY